VHAARAHRRVGRVERRAAQLDLLLRRDQVEVCDLDPGGEGEAGCVASARAAASSAERRRAGASR
jgi:hypothetical protein